MRDVVKKTDDDLQVCYAEVYAPNLPDSHGDFMTPIGVRKMAHDFLKRANTDAVDTQHDNQVNGSYIVESFIARDDDSIFIPGSWVVGVHIPDEAIWEQVKKGELNGFSMEALAIAQDVEIELEFPPEVHGNTIADDNHPQTHPFAVYFNEDNDFLGGETGKVAGHKHNIVRQTSTQKADGHSHRIFLLEGYEIVEG